MKRRNFLKNTGAISLPLFLNGFPLISANTLDDEPLEVMAKRAADTGKILVIIQLNGGNDGLNTVLPMQQWNQLINARSNILVPESSVLKIHHNDDSGLHPVMTGMQNLANDEMLTIIQGVSYPNPNLSHFRSNDIWMSGSSSEVYMDTGWIGRSLEKKYPGFPTGYPNSEMPDPLSINIGTTLPFVLQGQDLNFGYNTLDPDKLMNIINESSGEVPDSDYGFELSFLRMMKDQSNIYSNSIKAAYDYSYQDNINYPTNKLGEQLKIVARLINGGLKTPVYIVKHPFSFDSHEFQVEAGNTKTGRHAENLQILSDSIFAFQQDLIRMKKAEIVVGMTFSEFGRRIKSNNSRGTDHGVGAPVFFFGAALNQVADHLGTSSMRIKGMIGESPVLPYQASVNDQVPMQFDYRQIYSTVMQDWLGMEKSEADQVLGGSYSKLPIFHQVDILPVELLSFTGKLDGNTTILNWETASEFNNDRFEIERSEDVNDFEKIGVKSGYGTSNIPVAYRHSDQLNSSGTYYYRLKQIDYDGTATYSNIIAVYFQIETQIMVYPNPAQDWIIVKANDLNARYRVQVFSTSGNLLIDQQLESRNGQQEVDVRNLPKGAYFVSIYGQERIITQQFIKQ
ncbi:MAG TPA: T9SS type A sorting domain-containing protein [Chitinophagales bacterium]|nr:T9SS type A sorting domain-containing protein [Chitinophagales bacterium]